MSGWTKLDSALAGILMLSVVLSGVKGITRELVSLGALIWGFLLACWYYPALAQSLLPYARTPDIAALTAFIGILLAAVLAGGFLSQLAGKLVDQAGFRWFDRMLGASFGLVRGLLVCVIVVLTMTAFSADTRLLANSRLAPYLMQGARVIVSVAPAEMRARFRKGLARVQRTWRARP